MNIEGLSKFGSFKEYFDDVATQTAGDHQELVDRIEKDREAARNEMVPPGLPPNSANL